MLIYCLPYTSHCWSTGATKNKWKTLHHPFNWQSGGEENELTIPFLSRGTQSQKYPTFPLGARQGVQGRKHYSEFPRRQACLLMEGILEHWSSTVVGSMSVHLSVPSLSTALVHSRPALNVYWRKGERGVVVVVKYTFSTVSHAFVCLCVCVYVSEATDAQCVVELFLAACKQCFIRSCLPKQWV